LIGPRRELRIIFGGWEPNTDDTVRARRFTGDGFDSVRFEPLQGGEEGPLAAKG
jgi:hypothetical protein